MGFLEPVRDVYALGAFLHALAAFHAAIGALFLREKGTVVHELPGFHIVVHDGVVIKLKDARDIQVVRARHAIAAVRAGHGTQAVIRLADFVVELQFVGG